MKVTAKFKVASKLEAGGQVHLKFFPDYNDERNKAWAPFTPSGEVSLTVIQSVGDLFEIGDNFLVEFTREGDVA